MVFLKKMHIRTGFFRKIRPPNKVLKSQNQVSEAGFWNILRPHLGGGGGEFYGKTRYGVELCFRRAFVLRTPLRRYSSECPKSVTVASPYRHRLPTVPKRLLSIPIEKSDPLPFFCLLAVLSTHLLSSGFISKLVKANF